MSQLKADNSRLVETMRTKDQRLAQMQKRVDELELTFETMQSDTSSATQRCLPPPLPPRSLPLTVMPSSQRERWRMYAVDPSVWFEVHMMIGAKHNLSNHTSLRS